MKRIINTIPLVLLLSGLLFLFASVFLTITELESITRSQIVAENTTVGNTHHLLLSLLRSINIPEPRSEETPQYLLSIARKGGTLYYTPLSSTQCTKLELPTTTLSPQEIDSLSTLIDMTERDGTSAKSATLYILELLHERYGHFSYKPSPEKNHHFRAPIILGALALTLLFLCAFFYVSLQNGRLKQSQKEIEEAANQAHQASQSKSDFLASMSHEIRTPMNGIIGMTSLLLNSQLNSEQKHYSEVIQSSGENLLTIVNDILDFSKIEAGKLELDMIPFSLPTLLEETMDVIAYKSSAKSLELVNNMSLDLPHEVKGDPVRLRQIILNLVGNAVKFTNEGEVVLTSEMEMNDSGRSLLKCTITDTGIGMTQEQINSLFRPFTQADQSTTRRFGGTGLGLAISKQLTDIMGGEIHVESVINNGSTFWFTIPLESLQPAQNLSSTWHTQSEQVLIIEDNRTNRLYLESLFSRLNISVNSAATMEDAAVHIATSPKPFTATIIDNNIPGKNGSQIASLLEESLAENAPKVVMIPIDTINEQEICTNESIRVITKPIRPGELLEKLFNRDLQSTVDAKEDSFEKKNCSIMVVEDNLTNQEVAKALFSSLGYGITIANNGKEALQILAEGDFDIVFMDCQMPEMDGYEATRHIRENSEGIFHSDIPIIAMTAHAMKGDRKTCIDSGMNEYISKPISSQRITEILAQFISEEHKEDEEAEQSEDTVTSQEVENDDWASLPIFNKDELIQRFGGDESLLEIIIPAFIEDTTRLLKELKTAVQNSSNKEVAELGHSMKGASANISAESFSSKALEVEQAGKAQESFRYSDLYEELCGEFNKLETELKMEL